MNSNSVPYDIRTLPPSWHTSHGIFQMEKRGEYDISFEGFLLKKRISLRPDIVEWDSKDNEPVFDLIIGTETMTQLGVVLDFKNRMITLYDIKLPMHHLQSLQNSHKRQRIYVKAQFIEPSAAESGTKRAVSILYAKYEKADLLAVIKDNCVHLSSAEQVQLLQLLQKIEHLFDGTLGDWKTSPVKLELKHDAKPYYDRAFPIPSIHKKTLRTDVNRL